MSRPKTPGIITYTNPNPNGKPLFDCPGCEKRKEYGCKGYCNSCYRRLAWKRKKIACKECKRLRPHKAFGLCGGCHTRLFHYNNPKRSNINKWHNLSLESYQQHTKICASCGFDKLISLHHLDGDRRNNSDTNLVGLCPNCHKMIHAYSYYLEISSKLAAKGFKVDKVHPSNYVERRDEKK